MFVINIFYIILGILYIYIYILLNIILYYYKYMYIIQYYVCYVYIIYVCYVNIVYVCLFLCLCLRSTLEFIHFLYFVKILVFLGNVPHLTFPII